MTPNKKIFGVHISDFCPESREYAETFECVFCKIVSKDNLILYCSHCICENCISKGIQFEKRRIKPYYWLTVKRFFDPNNYKGTSFLMLTHDELRYYFPNGIEELNLGKPKKVLEFKKYLIFVFDYNISEKFSDGIEAPSVN